MSASTSTGSSVSNPEEAVKTEYCIRVTLLGYYEPHRNDYRESDGYGSYVNYFNPGLRGVEFAKAAAAFDKHTADEGGDIRLENFFNNLNTDDIEYKFEVVCFTEYNNGEVREEVVYTVPEQTIDFTEETSEGEQAT